MNAGLNRRTIGRMLKAVVVLSVFCGLGQVVGLAQSSSSTDQGTPAALAKGSHPLGSFSGSDVDTVNLFNGNLSMRIPLFARDGRSGMGFSLMLAYNSKIWRVEEIDGNIHPTTMPWDREYPELRPGSGWSISAGRMVARRTGYGSGPVCPPDDPNAIHIPANLLTVFTFTAPDGTEYEFRDVAHDGQFLSPNGCDGSDRGSVFVSVDGTAATFKADANVADSANTSITQFTISGVVFLRDGTRFGIDDDGYVIWQQDRNGNRIEYGYQNGRLATITDTRGRVVSIDYPAWPINPSGELPIATVTYSGFNSTPRTITIRGARLGQPGTLAPGQQMKPLDQLFNGVTEAGEPLIDVVTTVELPSGHTWNFAYNSYGEVALTRTPTGGSMTYDYNFLACQTDPQANCDSLLAQGASTESKRRVTSRSIFTDRDATVLAGKTTYTDPFVPVDSAQQIEVRERRYEVTSGQALNSTIVHTFWGSPLQQYVKNFGEPAYSGYKPWKQGKEASTTIESATGQALRTITYTWEQRAGWAGHAISDEDQPQVDPRLTLTRTTLKDTGVGQPNLYTETEMTYDKYNNVKVEKAYDYASAGSPRGALLRHVKRDYVTSLGGIDYDGVFDPGTGQPYANSDITHQRSLVSSEEIYNGASTLETRTTYEYDVYSIDTVHAPMQTYATAIPMHNANYDENRRGRGNVTGVTVGANSGTDASTSYMQYDIAGNVVKTISPRTELSTDLRTTTIVYSPTFQFAYPTSTTRKASQADLSTPVDLTMTTEYDQSSGAVLSTTGYNFEQTTFAYNDPDGLDRITKITRPSGAGNTMFSYSQGGASPTYPLSMTATTVFDSAHGISLWSTTNYDGLGRMKSASRNDAGSGGMVTTETRYDALSRPYLSSNPYRPGDSTSTPTYGWTRMQYDALGRVIEVTTASDDMMQVNNTGTVTSAYEGASTTVTDQAGKKRQSRVDAIGRLVQVLEPDQNNALTQSTTYDYDARGNLTSVHQGVQTRSFVYDALSRLQQATMPEMGLTGNGTTLYTYDKASNLKTKLDPRGITATSSYDSLNRPLTTVYTGTTADTRTPNVSFYYDTSAIAGVTLPTNFRGYSKGQLVATVTDPVSGNGQTVMARGYDLAGRVVRSRQVLDGQSYDTEMTLNEAGAAMQETYPSGTVMAMSYNASGQVASVSRNSQALTTVSAYTPAGAIGSEQLGNQLYHKIDYNNRLQPTTISLGTTSGGAERLQLKYDYKTWDGSGPGSGSLSGTNTNNGNIGRITIIPGTGAAEIEQYFRYDELNRLKTAVEYLGAGTPTPLGAPTGLYVSSFTNTQISLAWTDNATSETAVLLERKVGTGAWTQLSPLAPNSTAFTDTGLTAGTSYSYRVRVTDGQNYSEYSNIVSQTPGGGSQDPINAPSNLAITGFTTTSLTIGWTDNSTNETGFRIERSQSGIYWTEVAQLSANTTTYTDTGLSSMSTYYYRVRATDGQINSGYSNTASATTLPDNTPPTAEARHLLVSPVGTTSINLRWIDQAGDETGYRVLRRDLTTSESSYRDLTAADNDGQSLLPANSTEFADLATNYPLVHDQLQSGHLYEYIIVTVRNDPGGEVTAYSRSAMGRALKPSLAPASPTNATIAAQSATRIRLTWSYTGPDPAGGFVIYRRTGTQLLAGRALLGPTAREYVDAALDAGTTYDYQVYALGTDGYLSLPANSPQSVLTAKTAGTTTIGAYVASSGAWYMRNTNSNGAADMTFFYGPSSSTWTPLRGDWDGNGTETPGLYDPATGAFYLRNSNSGGNADNIFFFGTGGSNVLPIIGDWNGDGIDTIGLYTKSNGAFSLRNSNSSGAADTTFFFGSGGAAILPLIGDWNGDGVDTIGIYNVTNGTYFLRNANSSGAADRVFVFGSGGVAPLTGDWNADGIDTIGFYVAANGGFVLKNRNESGAADVTVFFGAPNWTPVVGDWDAAVAGGSPRPEAEQQGGAPADTAHRASGQSQYGGDEGERATESATVAWAEDYVYDRYGNRTGMGPGTLPVPSGTLPTINAGTNRLVGAGYGYDAAGNVTSDATASYKYDGENRLWYANMAGEATYYYDGEGRRVKKVVGQVTTRFVYDAAGALIAEYTASQTVASKEYAYGPSGLLATIDNPGVSETKNYLTPDHLGTPRIVTNGAGSVVSRHDYKPFGSEIDAQTGSRSPSQGYGAMDSVNQKFTGYERDTETSLDFARARYYAGSTGRFTSADRMFADQHAISPQSWNLYVYVRNNPLTYIDPTGRATQDNKESEALDQGVEDCRDGLPCHDAQTIVIDAPDRGPVRTDPRIDLLGLALNSYQINRAGIRPSYDWRNRRTGNGSRSSGPAYLYRRPTRFNFFGNEVSIGYHFWIKTDQKEAGLGPWGGAVPGQGNSDIPYVTQTSINDHSGESDSPNAERFLITGVDVDMLNEQLKIGSFRGPWVFGLNDCVTTCANIIEANRKANRPYYVDYTYPK